MTTSSSSASSSSTGTAAAGQSFDDIEAIRDALIVADLDVVVEHWGERLELLSSYRARVGAAAALELQVFAYGFVEQSHRASKPYCARRDAFCDYTSRAVRVAARSARTGL